MQRFRSFEALPRRVRRGRAHEPTSPDGARPSRTVHTGCAASRRRRRLTRRSLTGQRRWPTQARVASQGRLSPCAVPDVDEPSGRGRVADAGPELQARRLLHADSEGRRRREACLDEDAAAQPGHWPWHTQDLAARRRRARYRRGRVGGHRAGGALARRCLPTDEYGRPPTALRPKRVPGYSPRWPLPPCGVCAHPVASG